MNRKLLILEDDHTMRETLGEVFRKKGIEVLEAESAAKALEILEKQSVHVALVDMKLPDMPGLDFWAKAKRMEETPLCIFMTAFPEIKTAVTAMREGAFDYINKPFELAEMRILVEKAFEHLSLKAEVMRLRYEKKHASQTLGIIGDSAAIKRVNDQIYQVAQADNTPVLIIGESGTGKELVASAIHNLSGRKEKPFLKLNCSAIPETLLEAELFGHEKGAFTDAKQSKKGLFEMADTGSVFLDEIGDMSFNMQPKLLRALESQMFRRLGGIKDISVDIRIISATNQSLQQKIHNATFRTDLLYRLNVFTINIPPLRERVSDIPRLAYHFLESTSNSMNKHIENIELKALDKMKQYSWPGNIRELKNVIERACILADSNTIQLKDCWLDQSMDGMEPFQKTPVFSIYNSWLTLEEVELFYLKSVLEHCSGNKSEAARQLNISRVTLREKLRKLATMVKQPG